MNIIRIESNKKFNRLLTLFDKLSPFLIPFVFTIFYFLFNGYKFAVSDEGGWLVYLNKRIDPSLYANDYLWSSAQSLPQEKFSIFSDLDFFVSSIFSFNFPLAHFTLLFLTKFLLFLTIYYGSLVIFKNMGAAILTLFAFVPSYFFLGPLVGANENNFIPRVLVEPFILAAIILYLRGKWILASFLAGLSLAIHGGSTLPIIMTLGILGLIRLKEFQKNQILLSLGAFLVGALPLIVKIAMDQSSGSLLALGPISDYLREVIIARKGYLFLSNWNSKQILDSLFVFLLGLPFLLHVKNNFSKLKSSILVFYLGIIFANLFYFLVTDIFRLGLFLPIQFPRSLVYVFALNLILISGTIVYFINKKVILTSLVGILLIVSLFFKEKQLFYFLVFLLILVPYIDKPWKKIKIWSFIAKPVTIFILGTLFFTTHTLYLIFRDYSYEKIYGQKRLKPAWREFIFNRIHFISPKGDISAQLQFWVRDHTEKDAVILVDPDLGFFRNYSRRAVVFDHKDLGYVYYSDEAAKEIQQREADVADFENMTEEKIIELKKKYEFSYLVWKKTRGQLEFPIAYEQFGFAIYRLN